MLKAIETVYKEYKFRSRLEARWAVFFDTLGVKWEYETEGFQFADGTRYLPDFWLPDWKVWVEIKGDAPSETDAVKIKNLTLEGAAPVLVGVGLPGILPMELHYRILNQGSRHYYHTPCIPSFGEFRDRGGRIYVDIAHSGEEYNYPDSQFWFKECSIDYPEDFEHLWDCANVRDAAVAAKQSRFEFGQSGAAK